ncbi:MAG: GGDEF domain-containing protein [Burkholderiaceae bacterium]
MSPEVPSRADETYAAVRGLLTSLELGESGFASLLLDLVEHADALVSIKETGSGKHVFMSAGLAALWSRLSGEIPGKTDADLMEAGTAAQLKMAEKAALARPPVRGAEHRIEHGGQRRIFKVTRIALPHPAGTPPRHLASLWLDVTVQRQREQQLQQALAQLEQQQVAAEVQRRDSQDEALRDGVTGLYKRMQFDDQLRREIDLSSREHREFALVSIALDPLGESARSLGEGAQVRVLEALGRLLRSNTRAMDASCRFDERRFALLLSGVGLATAHSRMEGLRRQCATQIVVLDGRDFGFTVSMGVASFPHTAHTEPELLHAAETALIEAQVRGGNHVTLASIRFERG